MDKRVVAIILCAASALCLLYCAFSKTWFKQNWGRGVERAGLWSMEFCAGDECKKISLSKRAELIREIPIEYSYKREKEVRRSSGFAMFGKATFVLTLAAVAVLVVAMILASLRHEKAWQIAKLSLIASTLAILAGLVFVINKPQDINASWGVIVFIGAGLTTVIATAILSRRQTYLPHGGRDPDVPRL